MEKFNDSRKEASKICEVCGDEAFGFNFNAVSCESCKAFFRRNASRTKEFRCLFSKNCDITAVTRRFCQKCRLDKCFQVGMSKELIMSEEDKVLKKRKIEENKAKKQRDTKYSRTTIENCESFDHSSSISSTDLSDWNAIEPCLPEKFSFEVSSSESHGVVQRKNCDTSSDLQQQSYVPYQFSKQVQMDQNNVSDQIEKFSNNPMLIDDLVKNSKLMTYIFTNENLLHSLLSNSEVLRILMSDSQASSIIEETCENLSNTRNNYSEKMTPTNNDFHEVPKNNRDSAEPISSHFSTNVNIGDNKFKCNGACRVDNTQDVGDDVTRMSKCSQSSEDPSLESIFCKAIKLEYSSYSAMTCNQNSKQLSDAERAKLNELIIANKALLAPLDDEMLNIVDNYIESDPALLDVINLSAVAIRRLIKMSKKISAFKNMCQEDQLALLKGGCTEMMILRSAINYDPNKNLWKIPHSREKLSKIKVDILKEVKGNLYDELYKFVRTFDPRWRDENVILILSAITLFSPNRPKIIHSDVIKLEQKSYYYLFRRYLESIYPGCEAKSMFLKLIDKISELHSLNDEVVGVYLDVNPLSVEPLLIEIFDLKN